MSKIADQKALEAYPLPKEEPSSLISQETFNSAKRTGYIVGFDQAFQYFMEKAERFIENKVSDYFWWDNEECFVDFDKTDCLEQFKNYMQDESEN
jgi:hypothetical protein